MFGNVGDRRRLLMDLGPVALADGPDLGMEEDMDLAAQFEDLQERTSEASSAVRAATWSSRTSRSAGPLQARSGSLAGKVSPQ
jgi:hypothetical protein